jgi:hypothetical protein
MLDPRNQIEINSKKDCCIDSETGFVQVPLKYIIYPDNKVFQIWELFMTMVLLVSCFLTPVEIAFTSTTASDHSPQTILEFIMDFLFFSDVVVTFFCAY